jgi:hypothetical protein
MNDQLKRALAEVCHAVLDETLTRDLLMIQDQSMITSKEQQFSAISSPL